AAHMLNHHTTKMELNLNNKKTSSQDLRNISVSLYIGLHDNSLQTERVPRSSVMDRLQNFLPQMAQANEKLKLQIEQAPEGHYDIERLEESGKVIEMDVSLVELSSSDSDSDRESSQDNGLTDENLKLPGNSQRQIKKVHIQVLEKQVD
uniref:NOP protein chaperone 1 n=1 Tax=Oncorhynchus mykiss TaxID=8022 RepID=A0A8C7UKL8_ONCMY